MKQYILKNFLFHIFKKTLGGRLSSARAQQDSVRDRVRTSVDERNCPEGVRVEFLLIKTEIKPSGITSGACS